MPGGPSGDCLDSKTSFSPAGPQSLQCTMKRECAKGRDRGLRSKQQGPYIEKGSQGGPTKASDLAGVGCASEHGLGCKVCVQC